MSREHIKATNSTCAWLNQLGRFWLHKSYYQNRILFYKYLFSKMLFSFEVTPGQRNKFQLTEPCLLVLKSQNQLALTLHLRVLFLESHPITRKHSRSEHLLFRPRVREYEGYAIWNFDKGYFSSKTFPSFRSAKLNNLRFITHTSPSVWHSIRVSPDPSSPHILPYYHPTILPPLPRPPATGALIGFSLLRPQNKKKKWLVKKKGRLAAGQTRIKEPAKGELQFSTGVCRFGFDSHFAALPRLSRLFPFSDPSPAEPRT